MNSYTAAFSVQVPEAPPARSRQTPDPDGAVRIASGAFRVDVSRMLERLRDFRLADPNDMLLPFLRCAHASRATSMAVARLPSGLELRFDGIPFEARELSDPLRALHEPESADESRGRQLAYGLLALDRSKALRVRITSGGPSGQASYVLSRSGLPARDFEIKGRASRVRVYWLGAQVETFEGRLPAGPVEALLAGDELAVDLSQARVVRDAALESGLAALASHVSRRCGPVAADWDYGY